jgi:hypothetical protein
VEAMSWAECVRHTTFALLPFVKTFKTRFSNVPHDFIGRYSVYIHFQRPKPLGVGRQSIGPDHSTVGP